MDYHGNFLNVSFCDSLEVKESKEVTKMCATLNSLPWTVTLSLETFEIILRNAGSILVFCKRKCHLKRTCYIMTGLSIADLMVGVSSIEKVVEEVLKLTSSICYSYGISFVAVEGLFGCASIFFPVLISFERLYAIVWPYHHRAVSKRPYIWSIGVSGNYQKQQPRFAC